MDVEELIEAVKKRALLYETTCKSYKNAVKKEEAWTEVAEEIGSTGNTLSLRVIVIRKFVHGYPPTKHCLPPF